MEPYNGIPLKDWLSGAPIFSIPTLSITTFSIKSLYVALSITDTHYDECRLLNVVILSVVAPVCVVVYI